MKRILIFAIISLLADIVSAQQTDNEEFYIRAKECIEDFQMHLSTIANRAVSEASKDAATKSALELFIGRGGIYEYEDAYGNKIKHDPVRVCIQSKGKKSYRSIIQYLKALRYMTFASCSIESADIIQIENVNETGDGKYEAIATYEKRFVRYRDGHAVYQDRTIHKIKIYVEKEILPLPDGSEMVIWPVLLGDIYLLHSN